MMGRLMAAIRRRQVGWARPPVAALMASTVLVVWDSSVWAMRCHWMMPAAAVRSAAGRTVINDPDFATAVSHRG